MSDTYAFDIGRELREVTNHLDAINETLGGTDGDGVAAYCTLEQIAHILHALLHVQAAHVGIETMWDKASARIDAVDRMMSEFYDGVPAKE
jgi:hypothetical protein